MCLSPESDCDALFLQVRIALLTLTWGPERALLLILYVLILPSKKRLFATAIVYTVQGKGFILMFHPTCVHLEIYTIHRQM